MDAGIFFFWLSVSSGIALILSEFVLACIPPKKNHPDKNTPAQYPAFTVIVAARNEEKNLPLLLSSLQKLDYPEYSILIALDRCSDNSKNIVLQFMENNPCLSFLEFQNKTPDGWSPKKYVLNESIHQAKTEWLAFTDADCEVPPDWLKSFALHTNKETDIILGTGPYLKHPGILNAFIRYETARTAFLYLQSAHLGLPYMGVGRSLAYRKKFFLSKEGFQGFQEILSGDDDLLISHKSEGKHCRTATESPVFSHPPRTLSQWISQKIRHLSSAKQYPLRRAILPLWLNLCHGIFYLSLGFTAISGTFALASGLVLLVRWITGPLFLYWRARSLAFKDIQLTYFVMDILLLLYHLFLLPLSLFRKAKWKED